VAVLVLAAACSQHGSMVSGWSAATTGGGANDTGVVQAQCHVWRTVDPPPAQTKLRRFVSMRPWIRLQDWVALLGGAYTIISPIALSTIGMAGDGKVVVAMITLGALVAISSLVSLARPDVATAVWATTAFGVLLFVAPWVVGYAGLTGPAWTSWLVGVLVVVVSQTVVGPFSGHSRRAFQH
jgi:hypothetical protein